MLLAAAGAARRCCAAALAAPGGLLRGAGGGRLRLGGARPLAAAAPAAPPPAGEAPAKTAPAPAPPERTLLRRFMVKVRRCPPSATAHLPPCKGCLHQTKRCTRQFSAPIPRGGRYARRAALQRARSQPRTTLPRSAAPPKPSPDHAWRGLGRGAAQPPVVGAPFVPRGALGSPFCGRLFQALTGRAVDRHRLALPPSRIRTSRWWPTWSWS